MGLNYKVKWGSALHDRLKNAMTARLDMAEREHTSRNQRFVELEDQFNAFIPKKEDDELREDRRDKGDPQYTTLVLPYSYAMAHTTHTYLTSVFLSRTPIFQYLATHGRAPDNELAVEAYIDYQMQAGSNVWPLYVWLMDPLRYSEGILGHYWDREVQMVSRIEEVPDLVEGFDVGKTKRVMVSDPVQGYEGNRLYNVRPYDFTRDNSVSLQDFQKGEFCSTLQLVPWIKVVEWHAQGKVLNFETLDKVKSGQKLRDPGGATANIPEAETGRWYDLDPTDVSAIEVEEFYWRLVPKVWGLGKSTVPEVWVFQLAEREVIIGARPLGEMHGEFPFSVLGFDIDAYNLNSRAQIEVMKPLEDTMNWLINSHFYNVRRALNDTFVFDPSAIVIKDWIEGGPGAKIRLKPTHYGQDVRNFIHQLPVTDVTRAHISDMRTVEEMIHRVLGANDTIMGMVDPGGRKTATEVRTSSSFATNRQKTLAEWFSETGFKPLANRLLKSSQQHYSREMKLRIAGDLVGAGRDGEVQITPDMIAGQYNFVPVDGAMPVDRFAQANILRELFANASQSEQLSGQYDMAGLFAHIAHLSGLRNINRFRVQVQPDAQVQDQVASGQLRPAQPPQANSSGGQPTSMPNPQQIRGMGTLG